MKAIRHFGIVVADLERSLRFYQGLLGLKTVRIMEESGDFIEGLLGLSGVRVATAKLSADDGETLVELLQFGSHPRPPRPQKEMCEIGPSHIAFSVENLDALFAQLSREGTRFNAPPAFSPDGRAKAAYCFDPDGTPIELVQVLESRS